jgi:hypothetical protein
MKIFGCFLLMLLIFSTTLSAADFTLFGGALVPGKINLRDSASGIANQLRNPINVGVFGFRAGHGGVWGGEHTLAYAPNFLDSNSKALIYNSNIRITAPTPVVRPYATAGLGWVLTSGEGITDIGNKFAVNYGGGLKVSFGGPIGGRVDVRGYTIPSVQDQNLNLLEVSLGVFFGF